ncbi:MAG: uroporphyrinogen-III synthase [Planctomycetes bacterium]|nr:uroporphyrinogen-III synthase [Planctomycetota bacterium]
MAATPLSGRTVVVTRSEERASELKECLEALGATVLVLPVIRHHPAWSELHVTIACREQFERCGWVAFTSPVAVEHFLEASVACGVEPSAWARHNLAAVGPGTARALRERGLEPDVVSGPGGGEALARALLDGGHVRPGDRVLLPLSRIARPELREALEEAGVDVQKLYVYDTASEDPARARLFLDLLEADRVPSAVVFSSPSGLRAFIAMTAGPGRRALEDPRLRIVTIGQTTSAAVREAGLEVAAEAAAPTTEGLAEAVVRALAPAPGAS